MVHRETATMTIALDKVAIAGILHEARDSIHRPLQRAFFPMIGVRRAIHHAGYPMRIADELKRIRALGAERALVDRAVGIALNIDHLAGLRVDVLAAPDSAIRADAMTLRCAAKPRVLRDRVRRHSCWLPEIGRASCREGV